MNLTARRNADRQLANDIEAIAALVGQLPAGDSFTAEQIADAEAQAQKIEAYLDALKKSIARAKAARA